MASYEFISAGGTIKDVTSNDGTITVTDPTGPIVDLSAAGVGTYYLIPSGADDTAAVQSVINSVVTYAKPAQIITQGVLSVTGSVTCTNATAPITFSGPGTWKLAAAATNDSWVLKLVNSPNVTITGIGIDENGANQTSATVYGIYYDDASANLSVTKNRFYNIKCFAFMAASAGINQTANVTFNDNQVDCAAVNNNDNVVLESNVGTCTGNVIIGVGSCFGIYIYEANQTVASGNIVVLTGNTGVGVGIGSSTGCAATGNSVWGGLNDACYQIWKENDNVGARSQTDAVLSGNHAGQYAGAGSQPAAYVVTNASNTVISGGTAIDVWAVLITNGTCGAISVSDVITPGTPTQWYQGGTTSPNPVFNNVGATPVALLDTPSTVGTSFQPIYGAPTTISPTANGLYIETIFVPFATTITGIVWVNNSTQAGNALAALFNSAGTELGVIASTALAGGFDSQIAAFSGGAIAVAPGVYYIGIMFSSASAVINTNQIMGPSSYAAQGTFAMPTTITPPGTFAGPSLGSFPTVSTY